MKIKIKPKTGLKIVDPETNRALPVEGLEVEQTTYWLRRLSEGDVILSEEKEETKAQPAKGKKSDNEGGLK